MQTVIDEEATFGRPRPKSVRFTTPIAIQELMRKHPLSRDLFPLSVGRFPHENYYERPIRLASAPYALILHCSEGEGELRTQDGQWQVSPRELVVLPMKTPFFLAPGVAGWSLHWLHFRGALMNEYLHHLRITGPVTPIGMQTQLIAAWDALIATHATELTLNIFIDAANQTKALLSSMALAVARGESAITSRVDLKVLRALMIENIATPFDLDCMAASANMSKYHFSRRFKALTGQAPMEYLIHLKMQVACQQLEYSDRTIKQIAAEVGYDDPYYFSRLFKQVIGTSPQGYRKRNGNLLID